MIAFVVIALAMIALAVAWVMVPLLRRRRSSGVMLAASNIAILRDQHRELEADLANDRVSPDQHSEAQRELEQRVLEESTSGPERRNDRPAPHASRRTAQHTAYVLAAAIPLVSGLLYALWGNPDAFKPLARGGDPQPAITAEEVDRMVAKLASRLQNEPNNAQGWLVLARSYYAMNRYDDATRAFEHAATLMPGDANVLAEYADALGGSRNSLQGKPAELVAQALQIDPKNWKALALAGTAAFDRQDFNQAIVYWKALKAVVPANAPLLQSVDASIAEARALGSASGAGRDVNAGVNATAASGRAIEGTVTLAPQLAAKASASDTVFIFARAAEGSRMPLAIIRKQVKDLPLRFTLDDSIAMTSTMNLSSAQTVVVGARVSKSGTAMPQSGDLEGLSNPIKASERNLDLLIDRVLP